MSLGCTRSIVLSGLSAHLVTVEANVREGLPGTAWTGLPDAAVRESGERVRSAITTSDEPWPTSKITVGLLPASVRKSGSHFDLAVALAVLAAQRAFDPGAVRDLVVLGELGLDGRVHPVTGVLPAVIGAARLGYPRVVVPRGNAREARLVPGIEVFAVRSLAQLCAWLRGELTELDDDSGTVEPPPDCGPDLADVVGQEEARQAIEVAAAGGHHMLLTGPPGVGKTMLAERLPGLLPDLVGDEALEVTSIHSLLGRLAPGRPLLTRPPFCAPHHSATVASLVGGGTGVPTPGTISLAHRGLLFLDEATEFERRALDALRQPLESGVVRLHRAGGTATYPARFQLVLAANPCPCARGGRSTDASSCRCTSTQLRAYQNRLSGPLLDRIDLRARMEPVSRAVLAHGAAGEPTAAVRERVLEARARTARRLAGTPWTTNSEVPGPDLRRHWPIPAEALTSLSAGYDRGSLSTRGLDRVMKVAWTIADLAGRDVPRQQDVDRAFGLRVPNARLELVRTA
ncbi:MAG TPA: YifB family Mg chelatase-like AAA ATPase [Mycobacteriales bacterium]|jgi:magnesium chelatase family protein|nr:YifB family Mg chelatase-like AAA ATPase [Mycobacteriales bacterium]